MSTQTYVNETLTNDEKDALGEVGNICMGTSSTTLSTLLGKRVTITTPEVSISKNGDFFDEYDKPIVATTISYTEGIDGNNILLIKKEDALLITGLLMGNEGEPNAEAQNAELFLSVISEVMNQMVGSSSTALSSLLQVPVNISPPVTIEIVQEDNNIQKSYYQNGALIKISFRMVIEELLVSNIMQIMSFEFGKKLASSLTNGSEESLVEIEKSEDESEIIEKKDIVINVASSKKDKKKVDLKAVKYQSFNNQKATDSIVGNTEFQENIDLIMDVPLQVTVVLGKSKKSIKEILELRMGSVVVLDRFAGEMVDVLANGKLFARGEVVVIDDNYGVRITEITESGKSAENGQNYAHTSGGRQSVSGCSRG